MIIRLQATNRIENFISRTYSAIFGRILFELCKTYRDWFLEVNCVKLRITLDLAFNLLRGKFSIKRLRCFKFCHFVEKAKAAETFPLKFIASLWRPLSKNSTFQYILLIDFK